MFQDLISRIDMREPLLVDWVLDRIQDWQDADPAAVREIEQRCFDDDTLRHWIDHGTPRLLARMFRWITPERFKAVAAKLVERWPGWHGVAALYSAPVMAHCEPAAAAVVFQDFVQSGQEQFRDLEKWHGLLKGLSRLPDERARVMAEQILEAYRPVQAGSAMQRLYAVYMVALAFTYESKKALELLRHYLTADTADTPYRNRLSSLFDMLELPSMEFDLVSSVIAGEALPSVAFISFFYEPPPADHAPLDAFLDGLRLIQKRNFSKFKAFMEQHKSGLPQSEGVRCLQGLLDDEDFTARLHRKKQQPYFYGLFLAMLLAHRRRRHLDFSGIHLEKAVGLLAHNLSEIPCWDEWVGFFKMQPRDSAVSALVDALAASCSRVHIVRMMNSLQYEEFLVPLMQCFAGVDLAPNARKAVTSALIGCGEPAVAYWRSHLDDFADGLLGSLLRAAAKIGPGAAADLLNGAFERFWRADPEAVLDCWVAAGSAEGLERIAPETGQGRWAFDYAFGVLSLLNGRRTTAVEDCLTAYYQWQAEQNRMLDVFGGGTAEDTGPVHFEAELKCLNCGRTAVYRVHRVMVVSGGQAEPYVAEEITCTRCRQLSEFVFTEAGLAALNIEMMRCLMQPSQETRKAAFQRSPLELIASEKESRPLNIHGEIRRISEAIEKKPADAANYVRLGTLYFSVYKPQTASAFFQKAIEKDAAYIEAYFQLARIAQLAERPMLALEWLEKAKPHWRAPKFVKGLNRDSAGVVNDFCRFYNQLLQRLQAPRPPLQPGDFSLGLKIGRNDPCPCGSGKKYKKCCMAQGGRGVA